MWKWKAGAAYHVAILVYAERNDAGSESRDALNFGPSTETRRGHETDRVIHKSGHLEYVVHTGYGLNRADSAGRKHHRGRQRIRPAAVVEDCSGCEPVDQTLNTDRNVPTADGGGRFFTGGVAAEVGH